MGEELQKAEEQSKELLKAMSTAPDELETLIPAAEKTASDTQATITELDQRIGTLTAKEVEAELVTHRDAQVKALVQQVFKIKFRQKNLHSGINVAKDKKIKLKAQAFENFRASVVSALRSHREEHSLSLEDIFPRISADGVPISSKMLHEFINGTCKVDVALDKLQELLSWFLSSIGSKSESSDELSLGLDDFLLFFRTCYRVNEATLLTEEISIKDSKIVRRLNVGELFVAFEGPAEDPESGLKRVRGKALSDNKPGWATVAGNQGTIYLKDSAGVHRVAKATLLHSHLSAFAPADTEKPSVEGTEGAETAAEAEALVAENLSTQLRPLKLGELFEMLEVKKLKGETVICGRTKEDGVTGWARASDSKGTVFLKPA